MMVRLVPRSLEPGGYGTGREHDRGHSQGPEGRVGNGSEYGPASAGPSDQDPGRGFRLLTFMDALPCGHETWRPVSPQNVDETGGSRDLRFPP